MTARCHVNWALGRGDSCAEPQAIAGQATQFQAAVVEASDQLMGHPVEAPTTQVRVVTGGAKGRTLRRAKAQCCFPDGSQGAIGVFCDTGSTATCIAEEVFHFVANEPPLPVQGAGGEFTVTPTLCWK